MQEKNKPSFMGAVLTIIFFAVFIGMHLFVKSTVGAITHIPLFGGIPLPFNISLSRWWNISNSLALFPIGWILFSPRMNSRSPLLIPAGVSIGIALVGRVSLGSVLLGIMVFGLYAIISQEDSAVIYLAALFFGPTFHFDFPIPIILLIPFWIIIKLRTMVKNKKGRVARKHIVN